MLDIEISICIMKVNKLFDINKDNFSLTDKVYSQLQYGDESILSKVDVTILMPIYKHSRFLEQALWSALMQKTEYTYCILIVDNDADDFYHNLSIVKKLNAINIVYYRNSKNIGLVGNWNRVVSLAKSKFVTFLHDDDMFLPFTLQYLLDVANKHPDKAIIGQYEVIDADNRLILQRKEEDNVHPILLSNLLKGNLTGNGVGSLFERKKLVKLGGFSQDFMPCLDYAFYAKYVYYYGAFFCERVLSKNRLADNFSYECNYDIAEADFRIKKNIIEKINLPSCMLLSYIKRFKKKQYLEIHDTYLPNQVYEGPKFTKWDGFIMKVFDKIIYRYQLHEKKMKYPDFQC